MQVKLVDYNQLSHTRKLLLEFVHRYGDKRITLKGIRWLTNLSDSEFKQDGNYIVAATDNEQLIGLLAVSKFGMDHSFIAVHSDYRRHGIAKLLLNEVLSRMDKFYARVAYDNIPSLNTCFSMGMVAIKIEKGPTGKPTFLMGWGNWGINSVDKREAKPRKWKYKDKK